ncbi:MAG: SIMPL domain-containing protein [Patescibacteria group bacterium]|nr:SIMPL domain-containing protein [Patescibacteria group bacterium]
MNIKSTTLTNIFIIGIFVMMAYLVFSDRDITVNNNSDIDDTIAVDGSAETFVKPDTASVSFSVTKKAPTTDVAMDSVNQRMTDLVNQLKTVGVDEKDIKTTNYSVHPEYSYNDGKQVFEGYRVSQSITVVIRDLDNVSDVLATVNSAGVDNVSQLTFYVDETDEINEKLREEAIDDAKENAKKLASDLGVTLNEIVGYSDYEDNENIEPMYRKDVMYAESAGDVAPTITPTGENEFKSNVTVIYKIQ